MTGGWCGGVLGGGSVQVAGVLRAGWGCNPHPEEFLHSTLSSSIPQQRSSRLKQQLPCKQYTEDSLMPPPLPPCPACCAVLCCPSPQVGKKVKVMLRINPDVDPQVSE